MARARNVVGAVLATGALFTIAACGDDQSSPEGLGEAVADAANAEDADALKELTCKKDRAEFAADFDFEKMRKELKAEDMSFTVEFLKAETKGDAATLTFKTSFENLPQQFKDMGMPSSTENAQKAIQEDGNWVMCN